ncbi:hypothetical protein TcasGA2_TC033616 [Tribolium castaneum]|uniref:Pacifastin domain-containing protein n=1 Tax=Tribolium castaneum TaxID=7070 RepID=A0A139WFR9_TRICA|nr:PREDICTED: uncharacterized protein LOC103314842 [Tribolium castaneum]KYB26691.1 hypothetical protein TcasGA2_TC033616 [Tribolium castaneum]|eukprot:XP_008200141.1 PREDICTED: uncharacterized protein LOC103314842 [Tribolium castaneum]
MKLFNGTVFVACVALLVCFFVTSEATICKPLSKFKIDCNTCRCSGDGRQYSCTEMKCPPLGFDDFFKESDESGFVLLKPKEKIKSYDDDLTY